MKEFRFKKLDAFATATSSGNPAGMVLLESPEEISEQEMLQMASELRGFVNEVGYVHQTGHDSFSLRYFSAEKEVMFCGHATIAIMYDLLSQSSYLAGLDRIFVTTRESSLVVENCIGKENAVYISAPPAVIHARTVSIKDIAVALCIPEKLLGPSLPMIINAGLDTLVVQIVDLPTTLGIAPEMAALKKFCELIEVDIITIFTSETAFAGNSYRSRVFAPRFGYLEDPATGSGNAALGNFLLQQNIWDGSSISLEQNNSMHAPNKINVRATINESGQRNIIFGGGAVKRIDGRYLLHEIPSHPAEKKQSGKQPA